MNLSRSLLKFSPHYYSNSSWLELTRGELNVNRLGSALSKICLAVILLLFTVNLTAQDVAEAPSLLKRTDLKVGYFGDIFSNNGLNLGAEYLWKEKVKVKEKKKGPKRIKRQLLLNGSLGYSTNFATKTQNGVFAYSGLTFRRVNAKSREFFVELNPLGLYRSVLPTTYEVVGDDVSSVSLPGRSYYAPSIAIGIGRFRKETKGSGWYFNFQYTLLTNYNAGVLPIVSWHFGRKFNFSKK